MRQGRFSPLPFGFELREPAQKVREEAPESLIGICPQSFAHLRHAGVAIAQSSARPAPAKRSEIEEPREPVPSRHFDQSLRVAQSSLRVATEHFERRLESVYVDQRGDVLQFDGARNRVIDQLPRPFDFAKLPNDVSEVSGRAAFAVRAVSAPHLAVPFRVADLQRLLKMRACLRKVAQAQARAPRRAAGGRQIRQCPFVLRISYEALAVARANSGSPRTMQPAHCE